MIRYISAIVVLCFVFPAIAQESPKKQPPYLLALGDSLFFSHDIRDKITLAEAVNANLVGRNYNLRFKDKSTATLTLKTAHNIIDKLLKKEKKHQPSHILLSVGLEDVKEDKSLKYIYTSLASLVKKITDQKIQITLIGFSPPYDAPKRYRTTSYRNALKEAYKKVATQYYIRYYPDIFNGLDDIRYYRGYDQYHLNAKGIRFAANKIYPLIF